MLSLVGAQEGRGCVGYTRAAATGAGLEGWGWGEAGGMVAVGDGDEACRGVECRSCAWAPVCWRCDGIRPRWVRSRRQDDVVGVVRHATWSPSTV